MTENMGGPLAPDHCGFEPWPAICLLGALAARLAIAGNQSLWLDEALTERLLRHSLPGLFAQLSGDVHPPLFYLVAKGWAELFGRSELALRSLPALFDTATCLVVWIWATAIAGRRTGRIALVLAATSMFQIYYGIEFRQYALLGLLAAVAHLSLVRLLQVPTPGRAVTLGVVYAMALYTQYVAVLVLAAHAAIVVSGRDRRARSLWLAAAAGSVIALAPWWPYLSRHIQIITASVPVHSGALVDYLQAPARLLFYSTGAIPRWAYTAAGGALLAGLVLWRVRTRGRSPGSDVLLPLELICLVPVGILLLGSLAGSGAMAWKLLVILSPALLVYVAVLVSHLPPALATIAIGTIVTVNIASYVHSAGTVHKEDWRGAVQAVGPKIAATDGLMFDSPYVETPFRYYFGDGAPAAIDPRRPNRLPDRLWAVRSHSRYDWHNVGRRLHANGLTSRKLWKFYKIEIELFAR